MYRRTEAEVRILVLAPTGRDARLIADTLATSGMVPAICEDGHSLVSTLNEGAGAAIIAEEALSAGELAEISQWLSSQAPWSDFPFVVLTSGGRPSPMTSKKALELEVLGNVTFLERPVRPDTVRSSLRAALRARMRQYEMRHRQEALAQVNADLEQFAHSASHDLREPIRNIAIYGELIARRYGEAMDAEGRQFLDYMRSGAIRMEALVQDLLAYTQASGIPEESHEPIDAGHALELALSNLREIIRESGACIQHGALLPVRMREVHLQQLFQNLIGNAIKYRGAETPSIHIQSKFEGGFCVYSVRDNGIGVPPEYREQIFELFKRLHAKDQYPGTGLGLAICRRIVARYRGTIWVDSQVGQGSVFYFRLPR